MVLYDLFEHYHDFSTILVHLRGAMFNRAVTFTKIGKRVHGSS